MRKYIVIAAMGEHESWQSLVAALFDISVEEFEAGWQHYLATRYDQRPLPEALFPSGRVVRKQIVYT